jgi:hypothetical protein
MFNKSIKISSTTKSDLGMGGLVNLFVNDITKLSGLPIVAMGWTKPIEVAPPSPNP